MTEKTYEQFLEEERSKPTKTIWLAMMKHYNETNDKSVFIKFIKSNNLDVLTESLREYDLEWLFHLVSFKSKYEYEQKVTDGLKIEVKALQKKLEGYREIWRKIEND